MNDKNTLEKLSQLCGAVIAGYLKDGRWYLRATREYAIVHKPNIRAYSAGEPPVPLTRSTYTVTQDMDVDYYAMRDDMSAIAAVLRQRMDDGFAEWTKQQNEATDN